MIEGDIVLIDLPQSDGSYKLRPALLLKQPPRYNDFLVCGISTRLNQYIKNYDEILNETDSHFHKTGLHKTSLIRLFFLAVIQKGHIAGTIGNITPTLHKKLLKGLADFLTHNFSSA